MKLDRNQQWATLIVLVLMLVACIYAGVVNGVSEKCPNCGYQRFLFKVDPGLPVIGSEKRP